MAELIYRITGDTDALAEAKETLDVYVRNGVDDFNCTDRRGVLVSWELVGSAGVAAGPQATPGQESDR